jgi:DNA repair exonuclease SbcCD nuclease subunit
MKLFHVADIHLGRRRLDGRLPDLDFAEAFGFVAAKAVEEKADAFLIAGDLFDRAQVEPPHLRQAQQVLAKLKAARIPVIAIEGNHDKASILSDAPTWLQYLAEDDLLILLQTRFDKTGPLLTQWENPRNGGAYFDLGGIRFVGAGYLGAATPHKVREIAARLEPDRTHVLLLHAGPDYFVGEGGGFSKEDLKSVREKVAYLALGHIHKPMLHEGWACNPGSPENCDVREAAYDEPRGFAVLTIDPSRRDLPATIDVRGNPRRPCIRLNLDCTEFGNKLKRGAEALVDAAVDLIKAQRADAAAIIDLRLTGILNLDRIALDQAASCAEIERAAGVCAVIMDTTGLNIRTGEGEGAATALDQHLSREDMEKTAIARLVQEENLWGLEGRQAEFASLFYELKEHVRLGRSAEDVAELISQSPLVLLIQKSAEEQEQRVPRDERDKWKETGQTARQAFDLVVQLAEVQAEPAKL